MTISIGELQKNIALIKQIKEPIIVVDKRTNKQIARIEPIKNNDMDIFNELLDFPKRVDKKYSKDDFVNVYTNYLRGKYASN